MSDLSQGVREAARRLLRQKEVAVVIGFERGTLPLRSTPCFVRNEGEVDRLVWDSFCANTLSRYLAKGREKGRSGTSPGLAIVAKGCDSRAIVELVKEGQIAREQVVVIGVVCQQLVDRRRIADGVGGKEILESEERGGKIIVKGVDWTAVLEKEEYLYHSCRVCTHRNPVIYDILIGDRVEETPGEPYLDIAQFEAKPPEERWTYFSHEIEKCIRCYACRNACPLCYCQECFVDHTRPQWMGRSVDPSDTMLFHLMRAFHVAGRCIECGACERACPMGVDFGKLNRKLARDVRGLYGYESGISLEQVAPLATFRPDDPEEFILNP